MVSVFVEAGDSFGGEPAAKSENEVVVSKSSFNLTVRDGHDPLKRIDARDFCFNEVNFSIQQRLAQVKRNVVALAFTKSEADECGIKNKLAAARHERELMLVAELFSETFGSYHASEATTQNQNPRHHPCSFSFAGQRTTSTEHLA